MLFSQLNYQILGSTIRESQMFNQVDMSLEPPLQILKVVYAISTFILVILQLMLSLTNPIFCITLALLSVLVYCRTSSTFSYKIFMALFLFNIILKVDQYLHILLNHVAGIQPDYSLRKDYILIVVFNGLDILLLMFGLLLQWRMYEKNKLTSILARQWGIDQQVQNQF